MRLSPGQRYWLSLAVVMVGTLVAMGLIGGTVARVLGPTSLWSGVAVALVLLCGWTVGSRVRERKKLDLPLWHRLSASQDAELRAYRSWVRTGRIGERPQATSTSTSPARPSNQPLSKRDRQRRADVDRQRAQRKGKSR